MKMEPSIFTLSKQQQNVKNLFYWIEKKRRTYQIKRTERKTTQHEKEEEEKTQRRKESEIYLMKRCERKNNFEFEQTRKRWRNDEEMKKKKKKKKKAFTLFLNTIVSSIDFKYFFNTSTFDHPHKFRSHERTFI